MYRRLTHRQARLYLKTLARGRVDSGQISHKVAEYASRVTLAKLCGVDDVVTSVRLAAYFDAVARRRTLATEPRGVPAQRLVADAIVADLMGSGRGSSEVWRQFESGWSDKLPAELLDEYRQKLCA